jgi:hypothetical protein
MFISRIDDAYKTDAEMVVFGNFSNPIKWLRYRIIGQIKKKIMSNNNLQPIYNSFILYKDDNGVTNIIFPFR